MKNHSFYGTCVLKPKTKKLQRNPNSVECVVTMFNCILVEKEQKETENKQRTKKEKDKQTQYRVNSEKKKTRNR